MDLQILTKYETTCDFVDQVKELADVHRKEFGFLAASAYEQMALKHQIWVAVDSTKHLVGYLIFGGVYPKLKVFQLFVSPDSRAQGVGTALISKLIRFGELHDYLSISARVASDLPANTFWHEAGFPIVRQEPGGSTTNRIINVRLLTLNSDDLIGHSRSASKDKLAIHSSPLFRPPTYAIDLNPIFDITKERQNCAEARIVLEKGFNHSLKLCLTAEFRVELLRHSFDPLNDPLLKLISTLPTLNRGPEKEIHSLKETLRTMLFPKRSRTGAKSANDESDLTHLAHCIWNQIEGFITRESALLRKSEEIEAKFGVSIVSPEEVISDVLPDGYHSDINVRNSSNLQYRKLDGRYLRESIDFLIDKGLQEQSARNILTADFSDPSAEAFVIFRGSEIVAYVRWNIASKLSPDVEIRVYLSEETDTSLCIVHDAFEKCLRGIPRGEVSIVNLYCGPDQVRTRDIAAKKGFIGNSEPLLKIAFNGHLTEANWKHFRRTFADRAGYFLPISLPSLDEAVNTGIPISNEENRIVSVLSLFDFESLISPGFLLLQGRQCLLLPIRQRYANELISDLHPQMSLVPVGEVGLLLEKAYFRGKSRSGYFRRGHLVAFYISGKTSPQELIGIGRITYSTVGSINEIYLKHSYQGVLPKEELEELAGMSETLHVFTFDNFQQFGSRVTFKRAKELGLISKANLTTVEKLSGPQLKTLLAEAL